MPLFGPPSPSAQVGASAEVTSAPTKEKESGKKDVEFDVPPGFSLRGKVAGETLEAVAVLEIKDDGTLCLQSLNGIPLNADEATEAGSNDGGGDFVSAVEAGAKSK